MKSLMVMGTASWSGKSTIVTALCRAFSRAGVRVAPFKSQNMSNNAAVCAAGGEIGRAQAVQAEAAGLEPTVEMNPVLLKPESDVTCQVVIRGRPALRMGIDDYESYRAVAWPAIVESYQRLALAYDLVVIEGAGSAAEVNLRHRDIVNWKVAELAAAPVVVVADIDRGGVFASLVGTVELILEEERARLAGFLINKFRGDARLLDDGLAFLERRTRVPVLGVVPYVECLRIPEEDGVLDPPPRAADRAVAIVVVRFPRISNATDFEAFAGEGDVAVRFADDPSDAAGADAIVLPGTKSTIGDLEWLRARGWEPALRGHVARGGALVGICGGYQMLGRDLLDPLRIEAVAGFAEGLGFLDVSTRFERDKVTARVAGRERVLGLEVAGYEIHAGRIVRGPGASPVFDLAAGGEEGARTGRVWGTTIHGVFDAPGFRRAFVDALRRDKGLEPLGGEATSGERERRLFEYDRLADALEAAVPLARFAAIAGSLLRS